jgi:hypothetical protein
LRSRSEFVSPASRVKIKIVKKCYKSLQLKSL